jgi:hypothetical protein
MLSFRSLPVGRTYSAAIWRNRSEVNDKVACRTFSGAGRRDDSPSARCHLWTWKGLRIRNVCHPLHHILCDSFLRNNNVGLV